MCEGAACGRPTGDPGPVIRVGQLVLDRSGFGPHATLTVDTTASALAAELDGLTTDELLQRAEDLAAQARDLAGQLPEVARRLKERFVEAPRVRVDRTLDGRVWRESQAQPPRK